MLSQNFGNLIQDLIPAVSSENIVETMSQAREAILAHFRPEFVGLARVW